MLVVRPTRREDHGEMLELARLAGIGMTSLPPDADVLEQKIARAVNSFSGKPEYPHAEAFLFSLEDTESGRIVGTTGVVAHVGIQRPFYSYKLSTIVQASEKVGVYSMNSVLHMVNDYTGATELGSLFLTSGYRRDGIGRFLSRCRHLMLAEFPHLFSDIVISEIRGVQDDGGESPFYNNLARYFFQMPFKRADFIYATQGGQFIADLMPRYPIYVKLLPEVAQATIGRPLAASLPAKHMLEEEGFTHGGYIDIFDAGPTMECARERIRTVRKSHKSPIIAVAEPQGGEKYMIANTSLEQFRMTRERLARTEEGVIITPACAAALGVGVGDEVRYGV
ncbi:MAG: arginine N-succinyltransferase [Alphaproteobacteria bacterium]|nr:arginine N-succinyltransferase [Alphaproteobacteria bacterium]